MIIDINPILKGEKKQLNIEYLLSIENEIEDVDFNDSSIVKGCIKDMAGYITLNLEAEVRYKTECARCLTPLMESMSIKFEKTVVTEETELQNSENDDYIVSKDGFIDVDEALVEQIFLELPLRHLCKEDCKGLCPKCGCNLNSETCSCELTEPDPRFDVLRKLLENNKKN